MPYTEIVAVCSKNHIKTYKCILRAEPTILNVKPGGTLSNHQAYELNKQRRCSEVTDLLHNCYKSVLSLAPVPIFDIRGLYTQTKTTAALQLHLMGPRQTVSKCYFMAKAQPPYEMCFFKQTGQDGQCPMYSIIQFTI